MRIQAWGTLMAIAVTIGVSGCSTQTIHSAQQDETDELLFGAKKKVSVAKKTTGTRPKVAQYGGSQGARTPAYTPAPTGSAGGLVLPQMSSNELMMIADRIFKNESGSDPDKLVHWNDGENFASMGLGHFTWYPAGRQARFGNTFPDLLGHLQSSGVALPVWVQQARYQGAPWRTKAELMHAKQTGQVQELQNLLYQTRLLQAAYIVERARRAMPKLVNAAPAASRTRVAQNLNAIANTPGGWYALVDYVNFKGEGLNNAGGYNGQNWGLLQVLDDMQPSQPGQQALHSFADAASRVLVRRIRNSPPARNEARWLAGWSNRVNTYRYPGV
ncbi:hypothetical protein J9253_13480 [Thiothrix litoralis]|jgi:hypothetical protein|uniref:Transglycosylase SLT domain-containing protein n=1 Tax=Thiothrix litoralis TaxID=2891210 RepID=A0ABX7WRM2_9GAMM|nr:hypothetical protein [Thiothrix litoralis]QTR45018.1 hypothetical protein J9253_13480 [Thiothrix litoralis]